MIKTKVKMTKDMGRGVFAACDIDKKIVVEVSPCITLSKEDQAKLQDTYLRFYVFEDSKVKRNSVLALGVGSLFNHNPKANVRYDYDAKRNVIVFRAKRKICAGEQLFIDYGYNPVEQVKRWELQRAAQPHIDRYNKAMEDAEKEPLKVEEREKIMEPVLNDIIKGPSLKDRIKDFFKGLFRG